MGVESWKLCMKNPRHKVSDYVTGLAEEKGFGDGGCIRRRLKLIAVNVRHWWAYRPGIHMSLSLFVNYRVFENYSFRRVSIE